MAAQHDRTKLPQWAQDEIADLERQVVALQPKAPAAADGANTFVEDLGGPTDLQLTPLGEGTRVVFVLKDGSRITAIGYDNFVEIHLDAKRRQALAVHPRSSNLAYVGPSPSFD